ncbi:hypothetical protein [Lysobacter sp. F6437]|uniref:hypothetical protein n=1 Tax=Lysobacter sp. F6437 TaxID=3459296 RepID=UPI00403DF9C7
MSLWDPQQREWLQALGHPLWGLAGDEVEAEAGPPAAVPSTGEQDIGQATPVPRPASRPPEAPSARPRPPVPPALDTTGPEDPAPGAPTRPRTDLATKMAALEAARAGATREVDGPLREALLRATGQLPAVAARTLRELGVDPDALRGDAAAKRTLWRQLRPLRKVNR